MKMLTTEKMMRPKIMMIDDDIKPNEWMNESANIIFAFNILHLLKPFV